MGAGFLRGVKDVWDAAAQAAPRVLASVADAGPFGMTGLIKQAKGMRQEQASPIGDALRTEAGKVDTGIQQDVAQYEAARNAAGRDGFDWMRTAGNIVTTAPVLAAMPQSATLAGNVVTGAAGGAMASMAQPVMSGDYADEKLRQAGMGAAAGALAAPVTSFLSRIIKPKTDAAVTALQSEGIRTTAGQTAGGAAKRAEEALASVPILGDVIRGAERRSVEDFNRAAYNRALAPIGDKIDAKGLVGRDGIAQVEQKLSAAYDAILPRVKVQIDQQMAGELTALEQMAAGLGRDKAAQFSTIIQQVIRDKATQAGMMSGETVKQVESELGRRVRGYMSSAEFDSRQLGDALREAQSTLRRAIERQNPAEAPALAAVNEGWANFVRLQSAASMLGAKDGVFSPAQLMSAVKSQDKTVRKGAFARGDALMQDLAEQGQRVLGKTVPDSGTPYRTLTALGAGGMIEPTTAAAAGVAMLPYTVPGQRLTQLLMTARPDAAEPLSRLVRLAGPAAAPALVAGSQ